jgi:hypothetical protein
VLWSGVCGGWWIGCAIWILDLQIDVGGFFRPLGLSWVVAITYYFRAVQRFPRVVCYVGL